MFPAFYGLLKKKIAENVRRTSSKWKRFRENGRELN